MLAAFRRAQGPDPDEGKDKVRVVDLFTGSTLVLAVDKFAATFRSIAVVFDPARFAAAGRQQVNATWKDMKRPFAAAPPALLCLPASAAPAKVLLSVEGAAPPASSALASRPFCAFAALEPRRSRAAWRQKVAAALQAAKEAEAAAAAAAAAAATAAKEAQAAAASAAAAPASAPAPAASAADGKERKSKPERKATEKKLAPSGSSAGSTGSKSPREAKSPRDGKEHKSDSDARPGSSGADGAASAAEKPGSPDSSSKQREMKRMATSRGRGGGGGTGAGSKKRPGSSGGGADDSSDPLPPAEDQDELWDLPLSVLHEVVVEEFDWRGQSRRVVASARADGRRSTIELVVPAAAAASLFRVHVRSPCGAFVTALSQSAFVLEDGRANPGKVWPETLAVASRFAEGTYNAQPPNACTICPADPAPFPPTALTSLRRLLLQGSCCSSTFWRFPPTAGSRSRRKRRASPAPSPPRRWHRTCRLPPWMAPRQPERRARSQPLSRRSSLRWSTFLTRSDFPPHLLCWPALLCPWSSFIVRCRAVCDAGSGQVRFRRDREQ